MPPSNRYEKNLLGTLIITRSGAYETSGSPSYALGGSGTLDRLDTLPYDSAHANLRRIYITRY